MRRKKIENILFNFLMWLPIIFVGVYSACLVLHSIHNVIPLTFDTYFDDVLLLLVGGNSDFVWPTVCQAVFDFGELIGIPQTYSSIFAILFIYWVAIELLHILYDFVIFIPRAIRSIIEKGM